MLLGCIADDLTGATDLALMLTREGLRVVQSIGVPPADLDVSKVDVVVAALKSRTNPAEEAVAQSLEAARVLKVLGAKRLYFKYCSTFDSADQGNIGPVAEALLRLTDDSATIACPAFPKAGRTVYCGHLFVGGVPIHESPMKDHPLTPMRDPDLVRVLQQQTRLKVGRVGYEALEAGAEATRAAFDKAVAAGDRILIVDAVNDAHLRTIGAAFADLPLITGGSGIAMGLPKAYLKAGLVERLTPPPARMSAARGRQAILAGSCSAATQGQVAAAIAAGLPHFRLDPLQIAEGAQSAETVLAWFDGTAADATPLVYSTDDPAAVRRTQEKLGCERAGAIVEKLLADVARALPARGVTRMIVAGGETSGAVVQALGTTALAIGPEIDPGVPWTRGLTGTDMTLALKSGNFGTPDFFLKAWSQLA
jgi:uncharacterized protein YgbK (DUF1537 family)